LATDMYTNRLENAKASINRLVNKLYNDKIGLVLFAGEAFVQVPLTTDYQATKLFVESVTTDMISTQGTAIGTAIRLATNSFSTETDKGKVIVVITDGENHEDNPEEAAIKASEKGIIIHTIGIGSTRGVPIPISKDDSGFRTDNEGNIVITKLNEQVLGKIAEVGKGVYVKATNANSGLDQVYEQISKMEKSEISAYDEYDEKYRYPLLVALLVVILELFILERKNRWISKLDFFGNKQV